MSIYQKMKDAGVEIDHHRSDLYVPVNEVTTGILRGHGSMFDIASKFRSNFDNSLWYDIPFAFDPYWENRR